MLPLSMPALLYSAVMSLSLRLILRSKHETQNGDGLFPILVAI